MRNTKQRWTIVIVVVAACLLMARFIYAQHTSGGAAATEEHFPDWAGATTSVSTEKASRSFLRPTGVVLLAEDAAVYAGGSDTPALVQAVGEVDVCAPASNVIATYDPLSRTFVVNMPCAARPLFYNGFE